MPEKSPESLVRNLIGPALERSGISLVEVSWLAGKRKAVLRLTVDRPGGVTVDDCGLASEVASALLDLHETEMDGPYDLEVSSPGAERVLREESDFQAAIGRRVRLHLRQGEGEQVVEGRLTAVSPEVLELRSRRSRSGRLFEVKVARAQVTQAKVVVDL